jgi:hypothetical protein
MNEHSFEDPQLALLEAQLAAMPLQISLGDQHQLLYQCGLAVGSQKVRSSLRRWRMVASALAIVVAVVSIPRFSAQQSDFRQPDARPTVRQPIAVELDAWQLSQSETATASDEIARLVDSDPRLRSRTVEALTRQAIEQQ